MTRMCSIEGCSRIHYGRGWCAAHYVRWRRHGDPLGGGTPYGEPEQYFREVVVPYVGDDCLIWPYGRDGFGYARLQLDGRDGRAHRWACEAVNGPSPSPSPEREAAHSCGMGHTGCVNPRHTKWATHAENLADRIEHGTANRGQRCGTSKLTDDDVRSIRRLSGTLFQREIGDLFGITQSAVSSILSRRIWAWLD